MKRFYPIILIAFGACLIGMSLFPLVYLLITGDYPGQHMFYGLAEDDAIVDFLLTITGR